MQPLKKKKWKPDEAVAGSLWLDNLKLRFAYAQGADNEPLEVPREQIVDCKAAKGTTLVKVFLADELMPLVFDMLAKDPQSTMRDSLRA